MRTAWVLVLFLASASSAAAQCVVELQATPAGSSPDYEAQVPVPCWPDEARDLRAELDALGPEVRYTLVFGEWSRTVSAEPVEAATAAFQEPVSFGSSFATTPLLITRLHRVELIGQRDCLQVTESKLEVTPVGFTHRVTTEDECRFISIAAGWIAFQVEPASAVELLNPKWLRPADSR